MVVKIMGSAEMEQKSIVVPCLLWVTPELEREFLGFPLRGSYCI